MTQRYEHNFTRQFFPFCAAISISAVLTLFTAPSTCIAAAHCKVLTIQATRNGKGIDPRISQYSAIFKKKPFADYDTFVLLDAQVATVELKSPAALRLPTGISGSLVLNKVSEGKLDLTFTLSRNGKSPIRINGVASPNSPIFAAGLKSAAGIWIFGVACDRPESGITY